MSVFPIRLEVSTRKAAQAGGRSMWTSQTSQTERFHRGFSRKYGYGTTAYRKYAAMKKCGLSSKFYAFTHDTGLTHTGR